MTQPRTGAFPDTKPHYAILDGLRGGTLRIRGTFWWSDAVLVAGCLLLAWVSLKYYDIPIRKRLTECLLGRSARPAGPNHTTP